MLVTHDIGEAIAMSDTIYLFSNQPGTIHQIFTVPKELAALDPFDARQDPAFQPLFQTIWKELNSLEKQRLARLNSFISSLRKDTKKKSSGSVRIRPPFLSYFCRMGNIEQGGLDRSVNLQLTLRRLQAFS